jgi:hypothetical protein
MDARPAGARLIGAAPRGIEAFEGMRAVTGNLIELGEEAPLAAADFENVQWRRRCNRLHDIRCPCRQMGHECS